MGDLIFLLIAVSLPVIGFFVGRRTEKAHEVDLRRREQECSGVLLSSLKTAVAPDPGVTVTLVCGEAVIASDAFKTWAAGLRNIFGGEVGSFVSLYQRARREATVRMIEEAVAQGFDAVCNVRHVSADIGGNSVQSGKRAKPMATCIAFGTAYKRR